MPDVPDGCSIAGCDRPHEARGWCNTHYQRWYHFGDPLHELVTRRTLHEQFARAVVVRAGCWGWRGSVGNHGYGRIRKRDDGRQTELLAHRYSYELFRGRIPDGLCIDHLCRNRLCANPAHLEVVTLAENTRREMRVRNA